MQTFELRVGVLELAADLYGPPLRLADEAIVSSRARLAVPCPQRSTKRLRRPRQDLTRRTE